MGAGAHQYMHVVQDPSIIFRRGKKATPKASPTHGRTTSASTSTRFISCMLHLSSAATHASRHQWSLAKLLSSNSRIPTQSRRTLALRWRRGGSSGLVVVVMRLLSRRAWSRPHGVRAGVHGWTAYARRRYVALFFASWPSAVTSSSSGVPTLPFMLHFRKRRRRQSS